MWNLEEPAANPPLTDAMIREAEKTLGVQFPQSYVNALREKNGGSIVGELVRLPEQHIPDHLDGFVDNGFISVVNINGIGKNDLSVLKTPYLLKEWELPEGLVLLDGDGHCWIAFDYRNSGEEPPIVFVESNTGDALHVADSFADFFIAIIPVEEVYDENGNFLG